MKEPKYDYKCDICGQSLTMKEYYEKTDNLKFKPNTILTICMPCAEKVKNFIRDLKHG